jgi:carbon-monoxide dehydrogenase medium subunit
LLTGVKKTILEPEELLTEIRIPWSGENSGQSFRRLARVRLDIAKINCGVYLEREGKTVTSIRICLGSAAPTPVRAKTVEAALEGQNLDTSILQENAGKVVQDIDPITDARSTREYREKMAPLLVQEAVEEAWIDAGGSLS